jgi:hypothetical protein
MVILWSQLHSELSGTDNACNSALTLTPLSHRLGKSECWGETSIRSSRSMETNENLTVFTLHLLNCQDDCINTQEMAGICSWRGRLRNVGMRMISMRKTQRKRPLGRPRCREEDIKLGLSVTGCENIGSMKLIQDTVCRRASEWAYVCMYV